MSKSSELVKLAKSLTKKYGEDTIIRPGREMAVISTGSYCLDTAIGVGGLPRGRICDLYGRESAGKTLIATSVCAQVQKNGGFPVYIDAENALDERWANVLGLNLDEESFARVSPESGEQAFDIAEEYIKVGADVVVIDSSAALIPQECITRSMEDGMVIGRQAALISRGLQKLTPLVNRSDTLLLFVDQVRKNINTNPYARGEDESPTGGMALNFYSSVRIRVRRGEAIKEGDKLVGHRIHCFTKKCKVGVPNRHAEFIINYEKGIDVDSEVYDLAIDKGVIVSPNKGGQVYTFGDQKWRGKEAARRAVSEDPILRNAIMDEINTLTKEGK